ncbi:MAG TPA: dienelactone hydrolase family protein [Gammaproteobacteria bacterium]
MMNITTSTIDYRDGGTQLEGFLASPAKANTPLSAVMIAHMWGGRVEFVCDKARQLAELGYAAFALDMYGKGVLGRNPEENAKLMQPFMDNRPMLQQRITAAFKTVRALPQIDPGRIAVIGYCFGGLCALDLARTSAELCGAVSIHGLLEPPPERGQIRCKTLLLHGSHDPQAELGSLLALQQELTAMGADWQSVIYGHTQHAFTNPAANNPAAGTVYNDASNRRSWLALLNFLHEVLKP